MKIKINPFVLALATLSLSACSTNPVTPQHVIKDALTNHVVNVEPITKPAQLSERTKAQAVGNFVVSSVVGSVAASSGNPGSVSAMNANMKIGQQFGHELSRTLPDSYTIGSGAGADLALAKKLSDYFSEQPGATTQSSRDLKISVSTTLWELGYVSFLTSQDYALNYAMQVTLLEQQESKWHILKSVGCGKASAEKMPLEKWQAENYKAVDASAQLIVNNCFNKFLAETGLK